MSAITDQLKKKMSATYREGVLTLKPLPRMQLWWFITYDGTVWNVYEIPQYGGRPILDSEWETLGEATKRGEALS